MEVRIVSDTGEHDDSVTLTHFRTFSHNYTKKIFTSQSQNQTVTIDGLEKCLTYVRYYST